jgi:hypothetical protein
MCSSYSSMSSVLEWREGDVEGQRTGSLVTLLVILYN